MVGVDRFSWWISVVGSTMDFPTRFFPSISVVDVDFQDIVVYGF